MAASRKEFQLLFQLQASLGSNFSSSFSQALNVTKELRSSLSQLNSLQKKIEGYKKQSQAIEENKLNLAKLNEEHDRLQKELNETEQPSERLKKKFEKNTEQIQKANEKIITQEEKLKSLGEELKKAGINTDNLTEENKRLAESYDKVKKSQEKLAKISEAQKKNSENIARTKSQLAGTIGTLTALGAAFYAGPIKGAMTFDREMANAATLLDGNFEETKKKTEGLKKSVINLSNETGASTSNLSDGLYQVVSAFGESEESIKQLEVATKAGIAGGATTTDAINLLSAVTKGYGDTSAEAQQKASDLAFMTVKLGQTTFPELAASMGKVIPLGEALTVKQEELFGAMATLTGVTGNTAEVTTQLRGTLQGFLQPTAGMTKAMQKLGYSNGKAMLEALGLQKSLDVLKGSVNNDEIAFSGLFGSIEAKNAVLALTGKQAESLTEKTNAMYEAAGATQKAYDVIQSTPEAKLAKTKETIANLSKVLGDTFIPYISEAADKVSEIVSKFSEWAQENPEALKSIMKVAGGLAAFKVSALGAKLGYQELQGGILSVQKIAEVFKSKILLSGMATEESAGKLITFGKSIKDYFGNIKKSFSGVRATVKKVGFVKKISESLSNLKGIVGGKMKGVVSGILKPFKSLSGKISGAISPTFGKVTGFFGNLGNKIVSGPLGKIGGIFKSLANVGGSVLGPAVKSLGGLFGGLFGKVMPIIMIVSALSALIVKLSGGDISGFIEPLKVAFEQAKPVLESIMGRLKELGENLFPILAEAASQLMPLFGEIVASILPLLLSLIKSIVPVIAQITETVLPTIINLVTTLAPLFTDIITTILPILTNLLNILLPIITNLITSVLPIVCEVLNQIMPVIKELVEVVLPVLSTLLQALSPVIQFVAELFNSVLGSALQSVSAIIKNVMGIFKGLITFITGVFSGDWSKAWEGVKGIFSNIINGLINIFKAPINFIIKGINFLLEGLNKLKIPDWVPGIGGMGFNIPLIPTFAKGSDFTPDTFIAGEAGAELVTNAKGRKVFTAAQTGEIFKNLGILQNGLNAKLTADKGMNPIQRVINNTFSERRAPELLTAGTQTIMLNFKSEPVFHISGGDPEEIKAMYEEYQQDTMNKIEEMLRKRTDDERRGRYD